MIRKAAILGTLALGLTLTASRTAPVYGRKIVSSAQNFQRSFRDLKKAGGSLSAIERLFLSLVLTGAKSPVSKVQCTMPQQPT
jgi:hypothetical protein